MKITMVIDIPEDYRDDMNSGDGALISRILGNYGKLEQYIEGDVVDILVTRNEELRQDIERVLLLNKHLHGLLLGCGEFIHNSKIVADRGHREQLIREAEIDG